MGDFNTRFGGTPINSNFKTPSAKRKIKMNPSSVKRCKSDSDESAVSNPESDCVGSSANGSDLNGLSIVAQFDDLMRSFKNRRHSVSEDILLDFGMQSDVMGKNWLVAMNECQRLQLELDKQTHELGDLETKLAYARKLHDDQKKMTKKVESERDFYVMQLEELRMIVMKDCRNKISGDILERLNLHNTKRYSDLHVGATSPPSNMIPEGNTTGSLLSDVNYSMSEDDFDGSAFRNKKKWQTYRPSLEGLTGEPAIKKRRSSGQNLVEINNTETVRATTTLTLSKKGGPITATSVIESVPKEGDNVKAPTKPQHPVNNVLQDLWLSSPQSDVKRNGQFTSNQRQHSFQTKTVVMPDTCGPCEKRIKFGRTVLKCKACRAVCHPECKDNLPLPCVPCANTPTARYVQGIIGDYTPTTPPMVPAIIVHCLKEIESRGLNELGIYRVPGSEKDVKSLKEKFLKGKGTPCISQVDIHVICGTVKDFLRFLSEPLVSRALRSQFVKAVECQDERDIIANFYQVISELPQPNRDTLAYMILHLKRVAEAKDCKMPIINLAKVFGPTIVGYSAADVDPADLLTETKQQLIVMQKLLDLPTEYWQGFVHVEQYVSTMRLQQTPSTDSLLRPTPTRMFATPRYGETKKKKKFKLPTPPVLRTEN